MSYPPPPPGPQQPWPPQFAGRPPFSGGVASGAKLRLRGRIPLRLSLIFGVIGAALLAFGIISVVHFFSKIDGFARIPVNSNARSVSFTAGNYVGYFETPASGTHQAHVELAIRSASSSTPIRVGLYGRDGSSTNYFTYTDDTRHGQAAYTFSIPTSGSYLVSVASPDAPPGSDMAFGPSVAGDLVLGIALIIPGVLLVIAAIVLLIVGLVRRGGHKRELSAPVGYTGGFGYGSAPFGSGGQGYGP